MTPTEFKAGSLLVPRNLEIFSYESPSGAICRTGNLKSKRLTFCIATNFMNTSWIIQTRKNDFQPGSSANTVMS